MARKGNCQKAKSVINLKGLLHSTFVTIICFALIGCTEQPNSGGETQQLSKSATVIPVKRNIPDWLARHHINLAAAKKSRASLLFLGDSITFGMTAEPALLPKFFNGMRPLALGIGGDGTQHLLWRIQNGELADLKPQVTVVLIGTNNLADPETTDAQIIEGVKAIKEELRRRLPETKILLLGLLPREEKSIHWVREHLKNINKGIEKLANSKNTFYLDVGSVFLYENGDVVADLMPDMLHPSREGYNRMFEKLKPEIEKLRVSSNTNH